MSPIFGIALMMNNYLHDVAAFNNGTNGLSFLNSESWALQQVTAFANAGEGIAAASLRGSVLTGITVAMNLGKGAYATTVLACAVELDRGDPPSQGDDRID